MRLRPLATLSIAALSALALAGCQGTPAPQGTSTSTPAASGCIIAASTGSDSDAVKVGGEAPQLTASFEGTLAFSEVQRTVTQTGDGAVVKPGSLVAGSYVMLDGTSGDVLLDSSTMTPDDSGLVPIAVDSNQPSIVGAAADCQPLGSTTVLTIPADQLGPGASPIVVVVESVTDLPTTATGADQDPVDGMPSVTLADNGTPTVTVPKGDAPTKVELADLKKGDGPVVESGDTVFVQYLGVKWSDGEVFDSSWSRGAPASFSTTGVVEGFQQALEGQTVGSQVLVVVPPKFGYGASKGHELEKETLVFVVDILGTQRQPSQ